MAYFVPCDSVIENGIIRFSRFTIRTTRPTTGLVKGDMFIAFHGSSPKICICTSTAGQTVKQVRAKTKTFGRLTA